MKQNTFSLWLANELSQRHMTKADLARACKCSPSYISKFFSGQRVPTHKFVLRISNALELPAVLALGKAGLLPRGELSPARQEIIRIVRKLPVRDVDALLDLLKPFARTRKA